MSEVERIREQLRRAMEGGAWHGPAVEEVVAELTAERAATRPPGGVHSPWEVVLHVTAWLDVARRRLQGEDFVPTDAEDWPAVEEVTEKAWTAARRSLSQAHASLQETLGTLGDGDLERGVAGQDYDGYVLAHGVIQHALYHAGQLALLMRMLPAERGG